jgi:hypothetical protein
MNAFNFSTMTEYSGQNAGLVGNGDLQLKKVLNQYQYFADTERIKPEIKFLAGAECLILSTPPQAMTLST